MAVVLVADTGTVALLLGHVADVCYVVLLLLHAAEWKQLIVNLFAKHHGHLWARRRLPLICGS